MHTNNICHRDMKADNVMFEPETDVLKVIDLGFSTVFSKNGLKNQSVCKFEGFFSSFFESASA